MNDFNTPYDRCEDCGINILPIGAIRKCLLCEKNLTSWFWSSFNTTSRGPVEPWWNI